MNAKRTLVLSILLAALVSFSGTATPAQAGVHVSFGVQVPFPPQPLRHEVVVVRPGPGYVWIGGYWNWRPTYRRYVWVPGSWVRPPHPHAIWVAPRYSARPYSSHRGHQRHNRHYYRSGYWR